MKKERIVITAANGFMGRYLASFLKEKYEVVGLVRSENNQPAEGVEYQLWDGKNLGTWQGTLEGAKCVINLAGKSVDCRYTEENKAAIYASRLESTSAIGQAIDLCDNPPELWINAASATIYRHSEEDAMTEEQGELGTGFSVDVCQRWERSFFDFTYTNVRQIAIRTAIVLGDDGGALPPLLNLVRAGLGGAQGKGNQMFSWISIHDFCRSIAFMLDEKQLSGPVNVSAPNPVRNTQLMAILRRHLGRTIGLPTPTWLLKLGARMIKTETELILKSRFVIPEKLILNGFKFDYPHLEQALISLKK